MSHFLCHSGNIRRIPCFNGPAPNWWMDQVACYSYKCPFSYLFSEIVGRGRSCGEVFVSCSDWVEVLVTADLFPDGKRIFSTNTVVTSSGLHPASYPTGARVFSEKLMVVHLLKKFIFSRNSSSLRNDPLLWNIWIQSKLWSLVSLKIRLNIILVSVEVLQFLRLKFSVYFANSHICYVSHPFFLFCTMTNKCTIISQIITLLHVSTLIVSSSR